MAKELRAKRLSMENFPDAPPWLQNLLLPINFIRDNVQGLNENISIENQVGIQFESIQVTIPSLQYELVGLPGSNNAAIFQNGWANYATLPSRPCQYRSDGSGKISIRGVITGNNANAIFVLPPGYRPDIPLDFAVPTATAGAIISIGIATNGTVTSFAPAGTVIPSLDGILFDAAPPAAPRKTFIGASWPVNIKLNKVGRPKGAFICGITDSTVAVSNTFGSAFATLEYDSKNNYLVFRDVIGLPPGRQYTITLAILPP